MTTKADEMRKKIAEEEDFIYCPSAENSLEKFMKKHPNGVNNDKIAQVLMITPEEATEKYEDALEGIREQMKVGEE